MRGVAFGVVALLTGCNAAFDLAPTISIDGGADFDRDGILDGVDNCPTVANPDQANGDGDPFGDACDTCPATASASVHDEDGDSVGDACDVCPGVPDFQDDMDHDGVGDLCDPDLLGMTTMPRMHRRVLFDGFETLADWQASGVAWRSEDDTAVPTSALPVTDHGLVHTSFATAGPWILMMGYSSKRVWNGDDQVGAGMMIGSFYVRCLASQRSETGEYAILMDDAAQTVYLQFLPRPTARAFMGASGTTFQCSFESGTALGTSVSGEAASAFSVTGSPNVRITYIEVLE